MKKIKIQSLFREAWSIFKKNFGILVGAGLVVMAISGIQQSLISFATPAEGELPGLAYILTFFVSTAISLFISMGTIRFFLKLADGEKARIEDIFQGMKSGKHLFKFFVITLLVGMLTMLGMLALIIPGIIIAVALSFHQFTAYENTLSIWDTIVYNWELTKGYRWKIFLFAIFSFFALIGGMMLLIIGVFIAIPVVWIALALFYRKLQNIKGTHLEEVIKSNTKETKNNQPKQA